MMDPSSATAIKSDLVASSSVPGGEAVLKWTILGAWSTFAETVVEVVSPDAPNTSLNRIISGFGSRVEM